MRLPICNLVAACVATLVVTGCEGGTSSADETNKTVPRVAVGSVRGTAQVSGVVRLDGTAPVMKVIENKPCHDGAASPITEETVLVGAGGGLRNVFVSVESPALPKVDGATLEPAVLDQVDCRYVPHAVGVCVGQTLRVRSSDPTMHNVHYAPEYNESRNFGMTRAGAERAVTFRAPEFIRVKCDVHPWMTAYVGVFDTPFFAVTDANGRFEIAGLPPGSYKLVTWHERYGRLEQDLSLTESTPTTAELVYRAPK